MSELKWLNEPNEWSVEGGTIRVVSGLKTDFWRETFYGYTRDDGHFYHRQVDGDFTAEVTMAGQYEALYDQCGLMLRVDERSWVKTGVEFTDGRLHLSTVVTRGFSDWSVVPLETSSGPVTIRLTRHGNAVRVQHRTEAGIWQLVRLGHLDMPGAVEIGVMSCSPQREGFVALFTDFVVDEPISRDLHG